MAIDFNGTTDRIDYANVFNPIGQAITFAAWVYPDVFDAQSRYFWSSHPAGDAAPGAIFYIAGTTDKLAVYVAGGTALERTCGDNSISTGSWQHILLTWDGSTTAANVHIYVNGAEEDYAATTNGVNLTAATGSWSIGGRIYDDARNFDGHVAEPAVWNGILSAAEIAALAAGYAPHCFPYGLKWAPRLIRGVNDPISGNTGTLDGTSVADHPRIIYPYNMSVPFNTVDVGGVTVPLMDHHYRLLRA